MLFLQVRIIPRPQKKALPEIDTVSAGMANWSWMVLGGLLSSSSRQDYETPTTHNNRSRALGGVWGVAAKSYSRHRWSEIC